MKQIPASRPIRGYRIALVLASLLSFPWISAGQTGTGSIDGVVKGDQGAPIAGATISYGRLAVTNAKASAAMYPPVLTVMTDAKGSFSVGSLAAATYLFCVQVPVGTYLDPCHWSKTPPTFAVAAGQAIHGATINVLRGQQVPITISDPQASFAKEAITPDAHLTLGVVGLSGVLHMARLSASAATSRTYTVTVPFDTPTALFITTGAFQMADAAGKALTKGGQSVTVTAPSNGAPPSLSFVLQGIAKP